MLRFFCPRLVYIVKSHVRDVKVARFVDWLDGFLLRRRAAHLVAQDRYEAHATAEVDGAQFAPANGRRMKAAMSNEMANAGYLAEARRQYLRRGAFEEAMLGDSR